MRRVGVPVVVIGWKVQGWCGVRASMAAGGAAVWRSAQEVSRERMGLQIRAGGLTVLWCGRLIGDFDLANTNPMTVRVIETAQGKVFVFVGLLRRANISIKVWYLDEEEEKASGGEKCEESVKLEYVGGCNPIELELDRAKDAKLRGFGDAVLLDSDAAVSEDGNCTFRVACGLGQGKIHMWKFQARLLKRQCLLTHEGSLSTRSSLSCTCLMLPLGKSTLISSTSIDEVVQLWDLDAIQREYAECHDSEEIKIYVASSKSGKVMTKSILQETLAPSTVTRLTNLHYGFHTVQSRALKKYVYANHDEWGWVFPLKPMEEGKSKGQQGGDSTETGIGPAVAADTQVEEIELDENSYEGDLDLAGLPHGFGVYYSLESAGTQNESVCEYRGFWVRGQRQGFGVLRNLDSGQLVYQGDWRDGKWHGRGTECLAGLVEYAGEFRMGKRHGFGTLQVLGQTSISLEPPKRGKEKSKPKRRARFPGESCAMFWTDGLPDGIGRWTFPVGSVALNASNPSDLLHMGKIGCIVVHKRGMLLRELFFHREDGVEIPEEEHQLIKKGRSKSRNHALDLPGSIATDPRGRWFECGVCWKCLDRQKGSKLICPGCSFVAHRDCFDQPKCPMPCCAKTQCDLLDTDSFTQQPPCQKKAVAADLSFHGLVTDALKSLERQQEEQQSERAPEKRNKTGKSKPEKRTDKVMKAEERLAIMAARKLASETRKARRGIQVEFSNKRLNINRTQEMKRRKLWNARLSQLEGCLKDEGENLREQQAAQNQVALRLSRLQGHDLNSMQISELTDLQKAVDRILAHHLASLEQAVL